MCRGIKEGIEKAQRGFYKLRLIFKLGSEINEEPEELSDNWGDMCVHIHMQNHPTPKDFGELF